MRRAKAWAWSSITRCQRRNIPSREARRRPPTAVAAAGKCEAAAKPAPGRVRTVQSRPPSWIVRTMASSSTESEVPGPRCGGRVQHLRRSLRRLVGDEEVQLVVHAPGRTFEEPVGPQRHHQPAPDRGPSRREVRRRGLPRVVAEHQQETGRAGAVTTETQRRRQRRLAAVAGPLRRGLATRLGAEVLAQHRSVGGFGLGVLHHHPDAVRVAPGERRNVVLEAGDPVAPDLGEEGFPAVRRHVLRVADPDRGRVAGRWLLARDGAAEPHPRHPVAAREHRPQADERVAVLVHAPLQLAGELLAQPLETLRVVRPAGLHHARRGEARERQHRDHQEPGTRKAFRQDPLRAGFRRAFRLPGGRERPLVRGLRGGGRRAFWRALRLGGGSQNHGLHRKLRAVRRPATPRCVFGRPSPALQPRAGGHHRGEPRRGRPHTHPASPARPDPPRTVAPGARFRPRSADLRHLTRMTTLPTCFCCLKYA